MTRLLVQEVARHVGTAYKRTVLARLLLALLIAAFVAPAVAAAPCHDAPAAAASHRQPPAPTPDADKAAVAHVCIGCVPLADRMGSVAQRALPSAPAPDVSVTRIALGGSSAPALPPPGNG